MLILYLIHQIGEWELGSAYTRRHCERILSKAYLAPPGCVSWRVTTRALSQWATSWQVQWMHGQTVDRLLSLSWLSRHSWLTRLRLIKEV